MKRVIALRHYAGHALKVPGGYLGSLKETMQKFYLTKLKGFDLNKLSVVTLLFEGTKKEVNDLEKEIYEIAAKFNGIPAGEENGKRGYLLTFVIAYIRVRTQMIIMLVEV